MGWIGRHFWGLVGAIPILTAVGGWILKAIQLGGDIDFMVERAKDPGWIRDVIQFFLDLPPLVNLILLVLGLALIFIDSRRRIRAAANVSGGGPQVDETWHERDRLEVYEIACRSVGATPSLPVNKEPQLSRLRFLTDAIQDGRLKSVDSLAERDVYTHIKRNALDEFARTENHVALLMFLETWPRSATETTPPVSPSVPDETDRRKVAEYQASLKLPIIDDAIAILNHNAIFEQPIDDAGRFESSIILELKAGHHSELLSKLNDLRQRFVANNQRIGSLYVKVESIHEDIATILVQPYSEALMTGIYELSDAIKKLDNPAPANVELWLRPQIEKFHAGIVGVGRWRGTALFALFDLRRKLVA